MLGTRTSTDFKLVAEAASSDAQRVQSEAQAGGQFRAAFDLGPLLTPIIVEDQLSGLRLKLAQTQQHKFCNDVAIASGRSTYLTFLLGFACDSIQCFVGQFFA